MGVTGTDGSPGAPRPGIGDHPTSMSMFGAIMLGLYRRERTDVDPELLHHCLRAARGRTRAILGEVVQCGLPHAREGKHPRNPLTAVYPARDGKLFLLVLIDPDNEFPHLCQALGQPELASSELFATTTAARKTRRRCTPYWHRS